MSNWFPNVLPFLLISKRKCSNCAKRTSTSDHWFEIKHLAKLILSICKTLLTSDMWKELCYRFVRLYPDVLGNFLWLKSTFQFLPYNKKPFWTFSAALHKTNHGIRPILSKGTYREQHNVVRTPHPHSKTWKYLQVSRPYTIWKRGLFN